MNRTDDMADVVMPPVVEDALSMQRGTLVRSKEAIEVEAELDSFLDAHPGKREAIEDGFPDRVLSGHEIF